MLKATNLSIEYNRLLFKNLSFTLGNKEKVGLIGFNGCGKSTLLKIIAGLEQPDSGSVEAVNEKVAYLPQEYDFEEGVLVGEILEELVKNPKTEIYKVNRILNELEFTDVDWYMEASKLSSGQKMKLYLTKLFINKPSILLLDEPTNHLDIYGILWLEKLIKSFNGICIIVSHDRTFLDSVVNTIFEIDEMGLNVFTGNYNDYLQQKADLIQKRRTQFVLQERRREKFERMIENIRKTSPGEAQGRALQAARARMEREVTRNEINLYKEQRIKDLKIKGYTYETKNIIKVRDLIFGYDKPLLVDANFDMFGREKIWFYGANGIGKSTFIKLIVGELKSDRGIIQIGNNLKWTYFSQDQSHLNKEDTVEDFFLTNTDVSYNNSFGVLERFLFPKEMRQTRIGRLSPGQRARLTFAVFSQHEYDFMILDEPTNHLDIKSKEVIEEALREYQGSILLISHDRYFVESIGVDRSITIEDRKIV
jgi:ATP-binding cassette subfamily F protein 3